MTMGTAEYRAWCDFPQEISAICKNGEVAFARTRTGSTAIEPLTHFLTGACLGRSGFNRKTAYATLAMTLAAEAPDLDVLWGLRGPLAALQHHRGITHTLVAAPVVALVVTGLVWIFDRLRNPAGTGLTREREQPVSWSLIWFFSLVAVLSHLLLDFTNNYGLRPFLPFNPRWYSWDIVYVVEPFMLLVLAAGLVIPALLGLTDGEIGVRRTGFRGRGWAIAALVSIVLLYALRNAEHAHAMALLRSQSITSQPATKIGMEPYPIDPFRWFAIVQTADYYQTAVVHTRTDFVDTGAGQLTYKPPETAATASAKRSWLGISYLDWAGFPVVADRGAAANLPLLPGLQLPPGTIGVQFEDLRFSYSPISYATFDPRKPPLSGWVYVGPQGEIEAQVMDKREQK